MQQHKKRLKDEGKLPEDDPAATASEPSLSESEAFYEVLPEVLQAQARVDDPNAARRKEYDLRSVRGEAPPLTEAERRRFRAANSALGAAVGHVPKLSLSPRNKYSFPNASVNSGDLVAAAGQLRAGLSPQAMEVASRSYNAGMRALVYGSLLAFAGITVGGTAAVRWMDLGSGEELRAKVQATLDPAVHALRAWLAPLKESAEAWIGESTGGAGAAPGEFQSRLKSRYNPTSPVDTAAAAGPR